MTRPRSSLLLSDATHEVQAADHALVTVYPLTQDPKVLLSCVAHAARALELAALATESETGSSKTSAAIGNADAAALHDHLADILDRHARAGTVFTRKDRRVIASDDFSKLTPLSPADVAADLDRVKSFVHDIGRRVVLGGSL